MPPKTREEVRHTLLVNEILDRLEEHYENTRDVPENWWSLEEAQFLMRNYAKYNFTDDELDRASEVRSSSFTRITRTLLVTIPNFLSWTS